MGYEGFQSDSIYVVRHEIDIGASTIDSDHILLNRTHKVKIDANITPRSFDSVLGTNFVASESDVQLINAYLAQPLSELTQLDLETSRLQAKRDGIHTRIQPYQALLSPIRRLSLDIMEKIFLSCLPTERNHPMSTLEAPLKLGRICSSLVRSRSIWFFSLRTSSSEPFLVLPRLSALHSGNGRSKLHLTYSTSTTTQGKKWRK